MLFNTYLISVLSICACFCTLANSVRVLGVFPVPAPSHYFLASALMKGLAEAGHNVTMISPYAQKELPKGGSYRDVVLEGVVEEFNKALKTINLFDNKNRSMADMVFNMLKLMEDLNNDVFKNEDVQQLLKSGDKFDVVIVEQFLIDPMKIFGKVFDVPIIVFSSIGLNRWVSNMVANPLPLSSIPLLETGFSANMSFFERLVNLFSYLLLESIERLYQTPMQYKIVNKYFQDAPKNLNENVSLVLLNSHESLNQPVPLVPNVIQIGGFHVQPPKKLPKELQEYLDNANEGVVYFSLGSNLKSKDLPAFKRDALLRAFGKLKQKVLWKWEDDDLPGKPANVRIGKWLPQQDILAHPNVKLFITHSGLLSTTETIYHGVPILAIPVFGDQHVNAKQAVQNGYALSLPYEDPSFSEAKLLELLQELLTNPKYTHNVKKRSQLFHDRPMKPMDTAVYWVDYVVRTGGAPHLKVAGINLPWYKYHSLDVISFLIVISSVIGYVSFVGLKRVLSCWGICQKSTRKSKTD